MINIFRHKTLLLLLLVCITGCETEQQKNEWNKRMAALEEKEQQLKAWEEALQLRESALNTRQQAADSSQIADTLQTLPPALTGSWNVQMTCTETTCAGSAVGDVKNEQWELSNEANRLIARASTKGQLVRVYSGTYTNGAIELTEERASTTGPEPAQMSVRLEVISNNRMEGQREIIRENNCRIVYALQLEALNK